MVFTSKTNASIYRSSTFECNPLDNRGDQLYITHCPGGVSGYNLEPGTGGYR